MDPDDIVTYDDDCQIIKNENEFNSSMNQYNYTMSSAAPRLEGDFGNDSDDNNDGIYDNLDVFEHNEEDNYSGEDEEYHNEELLQNAYPSYQSKAAEQPSHGNETQKSSNESIRHSGKNLNDIVIVNSHLQEIVDIKNQIKELQDILHDKEPVSEDNLEDAGEDETEVRLLKEKLKKKVSPSSVELKRSSGSKLSAKRQSRKRDESSRLYKRGTNKMHNNFEWMVLSEIDKLDKKKRHKGGEDEEVGGMSSRFRQELQKRKSAREMFKVRPATKTKTKADEPDSYEANDSKLQEIENIPPSVPGSLKKILQMTAHTPEEKYKVLDARDKLYKIMREKDPTAKVGALVGTCPDMCPEKERLQREFQFQVSLFEMVNYPKNTNLNHSYAVKQYCRSSADQEEPLPHELRPVNVLAMTMSYLLHNVADHCEMSDDNLEEWYMFMWDRTRALRKELTQQGVYNLETVKLVEQCARFHIHCAERLVDQDSSIYDDKINTENLTKCLQTLKYMYRDLANENIYCPNESEFVCYSLLLNLNNTSVFTELSDTSDRLMSSEPVRFALDVMTAWETRNYVRFFNLVKHTSYLNCCILRRYFNEMRLYATKTMIRSYCTKSHSPQISILRFVENLNFEGIDDCCNFLKHCNFDIHMSDNEVFVNFNRLSFRNPETPFPSGRAQIVIGEKKRLPLSVIMSGGELPDRSYEGHTVQNSFLANGELKSEALLCKNLVDFANVPSASTFPVLPLKNKPLEPKDEPVKPKDSSSSLLSDIFNKGQKFLADTRETEPAEKKQYEFGSVPSEKPLFTKTDNRATNIFGGVSSPLFGHSFGATNIFSSDKTSAEKKNYFSPKPGNIFAEDNKTFGGPIFPVFGSGAPTPSLFGQTAKVPEEMSLFPRTSTESAAGDGFRFKLPNPPPSEPDKSEQEEAERKKIELENEKRLQLEREEREREENLRNSIVQAMRLKQEAQKREKERKEEEERRIKEERERKEKEERQRLEELARQENLRKAELKRLEELARLEEAKRKSIADFKLKIDLKLSELREKYVFWKAREFFSKWRLKTWVAIEERKMQEYFKEVQEKYPPVCTEEHLNGNPYGLIIPNILIVQKCRNPMTDSVRRVTDEVPVLKNFSVINVGDVLWKPLEIRSKRLSNKLDPFLWKIVFSLPDEAECATWKDIETFIEMNFVDIHSWQFGKETAALHFEEHCRSTFRYKVSIRRVRGRDLIEGDKRNPNATAGSNAFIFVFSDDGNLGVTKQRLANLLKSRSPLPQIPVIVFVLGGEYDAGDIGCRLDFASWTPSHVTEFHVEKYTGPEKEQLISQLVRCIVAAAEKSAPVTHLRTSKLSDFCSTNWFESVWTRIETSLSNYKAVLKDPNVLIECYNSCIDELVKIFLDPDNDRHTLIGDEFVPGTWSRPQRTPAYENNLRDLFEGLKLPHWPMEIPKSSHQLKYRIHQYCKRIAAGERQKMKSLKWILYGIIRRSLLWKGLDIYCDEDINSILINFPWIQLLQVFSRFLAQELIKRLKLEGKEPTVVYRQERIDQFSYESSLISKFVLKTADAKRRRMLQGIQSSPCLEHDSVIFAYSAAFERENNKRKREETLAEENLDDVFKLAEGKRQLLEERIESDGKSEDVSALKASLNNISDQLDAVDKRIAENERILKELDAT